MGTASISLVEEEINLIFLRLQREREAELLGASCQLNKHKEEISRKEHGPTRA